MKFLALQKHIKAYCRKVFVFSAWRRLLLLKKMINRRSNNLPKFWVSYVCIIGDAVSLVANSITLPILQKIIYMIFLVWAASNHCIWKQGQNLVDLHWIQFSNLRRQHLALLDQNNNFRSRQQMFPITKTMPKRQVFCITRSMPNSIKTNKITHIKTCTQHLIKVKI
jgi:hypothetical protein